MLQGEKALLTQLQGCWFLPDGSAVAEISDSLATRPSEHLSSADIALQLSICHILFVLLVLYNILYSIGFLMIYISIQM